MSQIQKHTPFVLLSCLCLFLISCQPASPKAPSSLDQSSRIDSTDREDENLNGPIADCNMFQKTSLPLKGYLSTYFVSADAIIINLIRLTLDQVPSGIETNDQEYIQFFRWKNSPSEGRVTDPSPIEFYFESRTTGAILNLDDPATTISRATLQNMVNKSKDSGVNINNFLDSHIIVLSKIEAQWDALLIATYDTSKGSSATGYAEALFPAFWANPNTYALSHPSPSLQQLHPMHQYRTSGLTDAEFLAATDQFCAQML